MRRRVVILQRETETISAAAARLEERGYAVVVARGYDDAVAAVREQCGALLVDAPGTDECEQALCGWVRDEIRPVPAMVGVLRGGQEGTTHTCVDCMVTLSEDADVEEIVAAVEEAARWWPGDD